MSGAHACRDIHSINTGESVKLMYSVYFTLVSASGIRSVCKQRALREERL